MSDDDDILRSQISFELDVPTATNTWDTDAFVTAPYEDVERVLDEMRHDYFSLETFIRENGLLDGVRLLVTLETEYEDGRIVLENGIWE